MKIGLVANYLDPRTPGAVGAFLRWCQQRGVEVVVDPALVAHLGTRYPAFPSAERLEGVEVVAAFGGDGTLLATARRIGAGGIPIFGVNLGGLGFLSTATVDELLPGLERIVKGDFTTEDRMVLRVTADRPGEAGEPLYALNDVVVTKGAFSRIIELRLLLGEEEVGTFLSDGIITSTPTGSTGYSLSAGGPIILPTMDVLLVTPICPHTLAVRPLVLPPTVPVAIVVASENTDIMLTVDGQVGRLLASGDRISISPASHRVRLIRPFERSFFALLRWKLKWGGREE